MKNSPRLVNVDLADRTYSILIGHNLLQSAGEHLANHLPRKKTVVVTDANVAKFQLPRLQLGLDAAGITSEVIVVPPGEATKSFSQLEQLCDSLLATNVERGDTIIALGGGVVGDLTGFAASILRRGIGFIQIPTTLLSQVDSSVGGKTGINSQRGKNLIGSFHQPQLVLIDVTSLETLPERDLKSGYAEVLKYGLISDASFFEWLEVNAPSLLAGDIDKRIEAIEQSCSAKATIVANDERESGERALLNLGHTFAHALEAATGYSERLHHGEAVAIGLVLAFDFSRTLGLCSGQDAARVAAHVNSVGLKSKIADIGGGSISAEQLLKHMYQDKKNTDGKLTFILTRGIGQAFIAKDVDAVALNSFLSERT